MKARFKRLIRFLFPVTHTFVFKSWLGMTLAGEFRATVPSQFVWERHEFQLDTTYKVSTRWFPGAVKYMLMGGDGFLAYKREDKADLIDLCRKEVLALFKYSPNALYVRRVKA